MTKEEIQRVLDLSLEYYKSEVFGTNKESEKPSSERIDWIYDKMKDSSEIPNDLEESAEKWSKENTRGFVLKDKTTRYVGDTIDAFIAGAKWQVEQDQETIELAEDHAYFAGKEKLREELLEWLKEQLALCDNAVAMRRAYDKLIDKLNTV